MKIRGRGYKAVVLYIRVSEGLKMCEGMQCLAVLEDNLAVSYSGTVHRGFDGTIGISGAKSRYGCIYGPSQVLFKEQTRKREAIK